MIESPLLLMSVMLFIVGVQGIFAGLLAELLNRTYHESQDKPVYTLRCVVGQGADPSSAAAATVATGGTDGTRA
jgi:hypothetical protein